MHRDFGLIAYLQGRDLSRPQGMPLLFGKSAVATGRDPTK